MNRRSLWILLGLAAAFLAGRALAPSTDGGLLGATPAFAQGSIQVGEGSIFVSTYEGGAHLWRFDGRRIELLGATKLVDGPDEQAAFIWAPGVERRKE